MNNARKTIISSLARKRISMVPEYNNGRCFFPTMNQIMIQSVEFKIRSLKCPIRFRNRICGNTLPINIKRGTFVDKSMDSNGEYTPLTGK